jgi:large subunit ribosomal protein L19
MTEEKQEKTTFTEIRDDLPDFRPGDSIKIFYKITEGGKTRIQPYEGIVISKKGSGLSRTFTVRRIGADSIGVERIFPLNSPNIEKIDVVKKGKVRRAKLYYLREKIGREAMRIKERKDKTSKKK